VNSGLAILRNSPIGIRTHGSLSCGPASMANTLCRPLSERRDANTHQAELAPTMIKSNLPFASAMLAILQYCADAAMFCGSNTESG
jgi:hypothetical protein